MSTLQPTDIGNTTLPGLLSSHSNLHGVFGFQEGKHLAWFIENHSLIYFVLCNSARFLLGWATQKVEWHQVGLAHAKKNFRFR
jgi:hypothetical protein